MPGTPGLNQQIINGRYQVIRSLGEGGMGAVWLVEDLQQNQQLALKTFRPDSRRRDAVELFKHEFYLLAALQHPRIAAVHEFGFIDGSDDYFFTSDYVPGVDLFEASENFSWEQFYESTAQICQGLSYIHGKRLIHRDLKPSNLMTSGYHEPDVSKLQVQIIDFGLAATTESSGIEGIRGTLQYLPPEIARSAPADRRSDLYSLGVTLFHCVTRQLPFDADNSVDLIRAHLNQAPPRIQALRPDIPAGFSEIIERLLCKAPADRFSSCEELIAAISKVSSRSIEIITTSQARNLINSCRFVGREKALNRLHSVFETVCPDKETTGVGVETSGIFDISRLGVRDSAEYQQFQLIIGEGGIGKSRLLREFRHHVQLSRVMLVEGRGAPGNGAYAPIIEVLRSLLRTWSGSTHNQDALRKRLLQKYGAELSKVVPELAVQAAGAVESLTPERQRLRLFDHMTRFILDFARAQNLVIYLHDMHYADEATAAFLQYFARNLKLAVQQSHSGSIPLLVVATMRGAETEASFFSAMTPQLLQSQYAQSIELTPLNKSQLVEVLDSMFGESRYPNDLVDLCVKQTRGNPFFVVELMRSLVESGQLSCDSHQWTLNTDGAPLELPGTVKDVVLSRIAQLSQSELKALQLFAVYRRPMTVPLFAALANQDRKSVYRALEQLAQLQILDRLELETERQYAFIHDFLADAIEANLKPDERRTWHQRCADYLNSHAREWALKNPGEMARHCEGAGDSVAAYRYCVKAAEAAFAVHANESAIQFYQHALKLIDEQHGATPRQFILQKLGQVQALIGDYRGALESLTYLISHAEEFSANETVRSQWHLMRGQIQEKRGEYRKALEDFSAGLRTLGKSAQGRDGANLLAATGSIYIKKGSYDQAILFCESGLDMLSSAPDPEVAASIRLTIASAKLAKGDIDQATREFEICLEYHRRARNRLGIAQTLTQLGAIASEREQHERAIQHFKQALEIHETLGHKQGVAEAASHLARTFARQGHLKQALQRYSKALAIKERIGDIEGIIVTQNDLAWLYLDNFQYGESERWFVLARENNDGRELALEAARTEVGLLRLYYLCGCWDKALTAGSEALRIATVHELHDKQARAYLYLGLVHVEQQNQQLGEQLLHRASAAFSRKKNELGRIHVTACLVDLLIARGDNLFAEMALSKFSGVSPDKNVDSSDPELDLDARTTARLALARARIAHARRDYPHGIAIAKAGLESLRDQKSELAWQFCLVLGQCYSRLNKSTEALEITIRGMEVIKAIYSKLTGELAQNYLKTRLRVNLKQQFQELRKVWS